MASVANTIGIGSAPNDGNGDTLRIAFEKVNQNFDDIYSSLDFASNNITVANTILIGNSSINSTSNSSTLKISGSTSDLTISATQLLIGNSTVNNTINSSSISVDSTITVGTTSLNTSSVSVSSGISVGNSSVNSSINSTSISLSTATISSNTLTLGTSNTSANGYSYLTNSLKIAWGTVTSNSSVGDITFETTFSALHSLTVTSENATYNSTHLPLVIASNTSTANVRTGNTTTSTISYIAIGT